MGPLPFEQNEPTYHTEWERTTFGVNMLLLMTGIYNADESRHSMERIPAPHWLNSSYYRHWLDGMEMLLLEKGFVDRDELAAGKSLHHASVGRHQQALTPGEARTMASTNHQVTGEAADPARFKVGEKVRAKNINPRGHTRLPRYIRGRVGTIVTHPGAFLYADSRARGEGDDPQHTYSVRFEGEELWGPDAGPRDAVYIDLYDPYLEAI